MLKILGGAGLVICLSAICVFGYCLLTQCDYFRAEKIDVWGMKRLSKDQILEQAGMSGGVNILSVNLTTARKRLLAHPDIMKANVRRVFPRGLTITVMEQQPLAYVDLGEKYIMNTQGEIYKKYKEDTTFDLPLVTGLEFSDFSDEVKPGIDPCKAVMEVLNVRDAIFSGDHKGEKLTAIRVDQQIGLVLNFEKPVRSIQLGYENYNEKFAGLNRILEFMKQKYDIKAFDSIDVTNANRVVLRPQENKPDAAAIKPDTATDQEV